MHPTLLGLVAAMLLAPVAGAQSEDSSHARRAAAALPACCSIVRIDPGSAVVTARETATGFTFRFEVKERRVRAALKVGQPLWVDFARKTVALRDREAPCCSIVDHPPPSYPHPSGAPSNGAEEDQP